VRRTSRWRFADARGAATRDDGDARGAATRDDGDARDRMFAR
jgi:hypothetical protein